MPFADIEGAANHAMLCSPEILTYAMLSEATHGQITQLSEHYLVSHNSESATFYQRTNQLKVVPS